MPLTLLGLALALTLVLFVTGAGRHQIQRAAPASTASSGAAGPEQQTISDQQVGALVLQRCGGCHSLERLQQHPQDAQGWAQTVAQMQQYGAQVAPDEQPILVDYLARHFGPAR